MQVVFRGSKRWNAFFRPPNIVSDQPKAFKPFLSRTSMLATFTQVAGDRRRVKNYFGDISGGYKLILTVLQMFFFSVILDVLGSVV